MAAGVAYTEKTAPVAALPRLAAMGSPAGVACHLYWSGWATVPLVPAMEIQGVRSRVMDAVVSGPEFVPGLPVTHKFALTGFAALPYPSATHNYAVRNLRMDAYNAIKPVLRHLAGYSGNVMYMHQYADRLMVRQGKWPGQTTQAATAESWHRDEATDAHGEPLPDEDIILGGWVNLNATSEALFCAPGSHFTDRNRGKGFGAIPKADVKKLAKKLRRVIVPPGHLLVFYENIAHLVASRAPPARTTQIRLFTGFRLTCDPEVETEVLLNRRLRRMDVMHLKSGQLPQTYSPLNWTNFPKLLEAWTKKTLVPDLHEKRTVASGVQAGTRYTIPMGGPRSVQELPPLRMVLPSGKHVRNSTWVDMTDEEFELYYPKYSSTELQYYNPVPLAAAFGIPEKAEPIDTVIVNIDTDDTDDEYAEEAPPPPPAKRARTQGDACSIHAAVDEDVERAASILLAASRAVV